LSDFRRQFQPRRPHRQSVDHVRSCCISLPFLFLSVVTTTTGERFTDVTSDAVKMLVHAFISSRLDYCYSLLVGVSGDKLNRLHSVQNAAARMVTGTRKYDHITPVLCSLHWLPIHQRVVYKVAMLVYKCLHGVAPSYLAECCRPVSTIPGRCHLRTADAGVLFTPCTKTAIGQRRFAVSGPSIWNNLPSKLRLYEYSAASFVKRLKTYLYNN
jgi:hypothetical protein